MSEALTQQLALLPDYLSRHLLLSVTALVVGIALSLPLGLMLTRAQRLRGPVLMVASAVQTIPGLALLALMVPLLRQIGFLPAVIALILYSMLPVLRNAVTGIEGVDPNLIEAGRGLGMTENQLLFRVQLPLAMPVIIAGIRTATVWVVGMATLSTPVGATSLGNYIFSGLQTQNYTAVLVGCIAAAALALLLDGMIRAIEVAASRHSRRLVGLTAFAVVALIAGGLWPVIGTLARAGGTPEIVIGAKTFTEQYVLSRTIADVLEDAGYRVRTIDGLGSTVAFDALSNGRIDAYVDYTGTIWANYMNEEGNPGRERILERVTEWLERQRGLTIAARLGFENAYAIAMTEAKAERLGVETIEDLVDLAPTLRMGGDYEFFARPEWKALQASYGLRFAELVTMDSTLMYSAVAEGKMDVISAFSTDGRIPAFDLRLLDDTRGALPPYDAVLLVRRDSPASLRRELASLDGAIDGDAMRAANRLVDLDGGTIEEAARNLVVTIREKLESPGNR
jgi:osmoprotectant transport system permease protein